MRNYVEKLLVIGDIVLIPIALNVGHLLNSGSFELLFPTGAIVTTLLYIAVVIFSSFIMELYNNEMNASRTLTFIRVIGASFISFVILSSVFYMLPQFRLWRGELLLSFTLFASAQFFWHIAVLKLMDTTKFAKKVLIIGTGPLANKIGRLILSANNQHVLAGYIQCSPEKVFVPANAIFRDGDDLEAVIHREKAQKIVVSLSDRRGTLPINGILSCKLKGIEVIDAPSFYEQMTGKLLIEAITPSWFIFSDGFRLTNLKIVTKNAIDKVLVAIAAIIVLPLFPVISLLIKLDSKGPVFYRQVRVGQGDRLISIYKFRSMRQDAESSSGAVWAQKGDTRITRVGWFLRKTRLDELPQLINVLKGEMSFVGPRPERPEFVEKLKEIIPYYSERHAVKPGITGWAQVKYSYGASVEDAVEKLRYDLYYIKHLAIMLDFYIIMETIKVVLFGKGSR